MKTTRYVKRPYSCDAASSSASVKTTFSPAICLQVTRAFRGEVLHSETKMTLEEARELRDALTKAIDELDARKASSESNSNKEVAGS